MKARWIAVSARGEATIAPDLAVVSLGVSGKGAELAPTRDDVNARTSSVLAALRDLGVAAGDLDAPDVAIDPEYDYRKTGQKLVGYRVARSVTVRIRALDQLGEVLDAAVAAGANEVHGTEMRASDPSVAEHAALRAAVDAAHAKAIVLADAAGVALGNVLRVEEEADIGPGPMPRMRMGAMAESGVSTEISAADLTVTRHIRAWFALD